MCREREKERDFGKCDSETNNTKCSVVLESYTKHGLCIYYIHVHTCTYMYIHTCTICVHCSTFRHTYIVHVLT